MIDTIAMILNGIFIALGVAMFVLIMVGFTFKRESKKLVDQNQKYKYFKITCNICGLEVFGTTQASINKSFYWHIQNRHPDAR